MKVHYTGFEPWGDISYNPSWDIAFNAAEVSGASAELLPVSFDVVEREFDGIVIHFGVAVKREFIELERYAHNIKMEDEISSRLIEDGKVAYETGLDLSNHITNLNTEISEWNFRESRDAGNFVCNALYYSSLSHNPKRIFIHVPMMESKSAKDLGRQLGVYFDKVFI